MKKKKIEKNIWFDLLDCQREKDFKLFKFGAWCVTHFVWHKMSYTTFDISTERTVVFRFIWARIKIR